MKPQGLWGEAKGEDFKRDFSEGGLAGEVSPTVKTLDKILAFLKERSLLQKPVMAGSLIDAEFIVERP